LEKVKVVYCNKFEFYYFPLKLEEKNRVLSEDYSGENSERLKIISLFQVDHQKRKRTNLN
jgi:hypothetical protein